MNILITGVNGLVGKEIARLLGKQNRIIGISRAKEQSCDVPLEYHSSDISTPDFCEAFVRSPIDIIIHCAASLNSDPYSAELLSTNCIGTQNIGILAQKIHCRQVIYISSIPVIGIPKYLPIDESHPVSPNTIYHTTKYFGELYLKNALKEINVAILRLPSPIGPEMDENKFVPLVVKKCLQDENITLFGNGERVQNYIDVKDVASAVELAIGYSAKGTYNIASEISYSNREVAEMATKLLNSKSKIVYAGIDDEESNKWEINVDKAKHDFNFSPTINLETSLCEISKRFV